MNYDLLIKNIEQNKFSNIISNRKAVSDRKGKVKLYHHGSATHSILSNRRSKNYERVEAIKLDDFLKDVKNIDLLKIDVEGAEYLVLKGAEKTLKKTKKIIIEIGEKNLEKIELFLKSYNFQIKKIGNIMYAQKI